MRMVLVGLQFLSQSLRFFVDRINETLDAHADVLPPLASKEDSTRTAEAGGLWNLRTRILRRMAERRVAVPAGRPNLDWAEQQPVVRHPVDFQLQEQDRAAILSGEAIYITGHALAKADLICRIAGRLEIFWYWVVDVDRPWIIVDVALPAHQNVNAGHCELNGREVIRVNRKVRQQGRRIIAAGHSHGNMVVFSSNTDIEMICQLAREVTGFVSDELAARSNDIRPDENGSDGQPRFVATFADNPELTARITTTRPHFAKRDLGAIDVSLAAPHIVSLFSTHNARGDRYFPALVVSQCPCCGTQYEAFNDDLTIHIVGPEEFDAEEADAIIEELKQSLHVDSAIAAVASDEADGARTSAANGGIVSATQTNSAAASTVATQTGEEPPLTRPADYEVRRRGESEVIGYVAAAVLEEAAYRFRELEQALGWSEVDASLQQGRKSSD